MSSTRLAPKLAYVGNLLRSGWDQAHELVAPRHGIADTMLVERQDLLQRPVVREVAHVQPRRLVRRRPEVRVETEVPEHEIGAPVAVEVRGRHAVPPSLRLRQPGLRRPVDEPTVLLAEDAHRHPFADDDEVERLRSRTRHPCRGRHHPGLAEAGRDLVGHVGELSLAVVPQQVAARRGAVLSRDDARADEQVDVAVAVEIAGHHARSVVEERGQRARCLAERAVAVVEVQPVEQRVVLARELVAGAHDVEIEIAIAVGVEERGVHVLGQAVGGDAGLGDRAEGATLLLNEQRTGLPLRAADVHVVEPVAVHVADGERGPLGRQPVRHERLAAVVEELVLAVPNVDAELGS